MDVYAHENVREIEKLQREIIDQANETTMVRQQLEMLADNLYEEFRKHNDLVYVLISNWHPDFVGKDIESVMDSDFSKAAAKLTISREHGFADWKTVEDLRETTFNLEFENAVDTLLKGDLDSLNKQLSSNKELLKDRSRFGHRATLLHYVSNNGVETRRQVVPLNLPAITRLLIENGADKNAKASVYGGQFTALELASTSAHPKDAGIAEDLIKVLESA